MLRTAPATVLAVPRSHFIVGPAYDAVLFVFAPPLSLVVAIMHFWYDGFVWSVRRRQV
jgi:hypothetical protein